MSAPRRPRGLGRAGGKLWDEIAASVAPDWELDGRDLALLSRACELADTAAALRADVAEHGRMTTGSTGQLTLHPAIREIRATTTAIAAVLAKVEIRAPRERSGPLSKRQRDQLADARRMRWPKAG